MQVCPCWGTNLWSFTGIPSASAGRGSRGTGAGCSCAGCWTDRRSSSAPCRGWESCSAVSSFGLVRFVSAHAPGEPPRKARVSYAKGWSMFFIHSDLKHSSWLDALFVLWFVWTIIYANRLNPDRTLIFHPQLRAMHHGKDWWCSQRVALMNFCSLK